MVFQNVFFRKNKLKMTKKSLKSMEGLASPELDSRVLNWTQTGIVQPGESGTDRLGSERRTVRRFVNTNDDKSKRSSGSELQEENMSR